MIYLKKDNETQTAFIPKNGEYEGKKTYKEGYDEGYNDGLYVGKLTPYTTKGVFDKNGYYDRVWAIDWSRNVEMAISWLDNDNIIEVSFFALENSALISTRGAFIDIFLQDEKMIVNYKNFMLEIPCKYQMWHTLKLQDKYVYLDGERYEYPNFDEYFNGTAYFGKSRRNGMFCRSLVSYIYVTEDNGVEMYYYYGREDGKVKRLRNENGNWLFQTMEFGVWNYATNTPPMDDVLVRVEGGNCPELTELNVNSNGRYEGAYNVVNVDVPDVNGSYDEGYNNGYNDGKAEGGSCNIEETRWAEPTPADVDGSGYLVYHKSEGYDGMDRVALNMNGYNELKYNEGYEAGKAEGGDCPELTELNVTENGTYEGAYNIVNVNVDVPTEGGDCDYQDYRELILRAKVEETGWVDENRLWDKSKIIKYDDFNEKTANTIMFIDSDTEGWRGEYVTIVQKVSQAIRIDEGLFTNLEEIYELEIECTTIGENAFNGCTNLTKLVLPYPSTIGENAFKDCTNLKEIVFNTIGYISPSAFDGCPKTGIIKVKDNGFDASKLPSTLSNWRIVYVLSGEVEGIIDVAKNGLKFAHSTFKEIPDFLDFSNVTDMSRMFESCGKLTTISKIDTSNATNMENMFYYCTNLTTIPQLDTSKVTNMSDAFSRCTALTSLPALNMQSLNMYSFAGMFGNTELPKLINLGGFLNLKLSLTSDRNLKKLPNLTYKSCINVLNGLYDFTGNGETPTSAQGELKVHPNFLTTVGDEISIATNKGWQILA